jgi:hypothetical protein
MVIFKRRVLVTGSFGPAKQVFVGDFPATPDQSNVPAHRVVIECEGGHNEYSVSLTAKEARELRDYLDAVNLVD